MKDWERGRRKHASHPWKRVRPKPRKHGPQCVPQEKSETSRLLLAPLSLSTPRLPVCLSPSLYPSPLPPTYFSSTPVSFGRFSTWIQKPAVGISRNAGNRGEGGRGVHAIAIVSSVGKGLYKAASWLSFRGDNVGKIWSHGVCVCEGVSVCEWMCVCITVCVCTCDCECVHGREREIERKRKKEKVRCYEGLNLCVYLYHSSSWENRRVGRERTEEWKEVWEPWLLWWIL